MGSNVRMEMDCIILGDAGTGKNYLAKRIVDLLLQAGIITKSKPECVDAADFNLWMDKFDENLNNCTGGVLLLTNVQKLLPDGKAIDVNDLDRVFARMRKRDTKMPVIIMTGLRRELEEFLDYNPDIGALFEFRFDLKPFDEEGLAQICVKLLRENYQLGITDEAVKKLKAHFIWMIRNGDGINSNGHLAEKKADELAINAVKRGAKEVDEQDVRGNIFVPRTETEIWKELDDFIGLQNVKDEIHKIIDNINEAKRNGSTVRIENHYVFTGNPGTGKTTIARIFADILSALGVLPKGQLVEVSGRDLIADIVGGTERNVQEKVDEAMGGVLFIDEAYGLNDDSFGKAAIEKLIKLLSDHKGEFICIIAGYRKEMSDFLRMNTGLDRRFNKKIEFEDYNAKELEQIFRIMMKKEGKKNGVESYRLDDKAEQMIHIEFEKMYNYRSEDFGNAGEVGNFLNNAIENQRIRLRDMSNEERERNKNILTYEDITGGETEKVIDLKEIMMELDQMVGLESVKESLTDLAASIINEQRDAQEENRKPEINVSHYLFLGNPGTGKTTVARLMGKILYSLGVIRRPEVIEVSRKDMVSVYQGGTAEKTNEVVMRAVRNGCILFIDEAYSLCTNENDTYGQEAINTLTPLLLNYKGKFVCIAAGYTREMNYFLDQNSGLSSRFNETITFEDYNADDLFHIFVSMAQHHPKHPIISDEALLSVKHLMARAYAARTANFGNARTVQNTLEKAMKNRDRRTLFANDLNKEQRKTIIADDINKIKLEEIMR
jgi:SpoVK/Ycf46/Vps4 family AAA+-type ATPase